MKCDDCGVNPSLCLMYIKHLSIMNTKVSPKEVCFIQVSLYTEKVINTFYIFWAVNILCIFIAMLFLLIHTYNITKESSTKYIFN